MATNIEVLASSKIVEEVEEQVLKNLKGNENNN